MRRVLHCPVAGRFTRKSHPGASETNVGEIETGKRLVPKKTEDTCAEKGSEVLETLPARKSTAGGVENIPGIELDSGDEVDEPLGESLRGNVWLSSPKTVFSNPNHS